MTELLSFDAGSLVRIFAFLVAGAGVSFALTPALTNFLYKHKLWKRQRTHAITGEKLQVYSKLHAHKHRKKIPTMAGALIWSTVAFITIFFNLSRAETFLPLFTLLSFGLLGLVDDLINVLGNNKVAGLSFRMKFIWLIILSALGAWWFIAKLDWTVIHIPGGNLFALPYSIELGYWYFPLFMLVIVSSANAVNFTDGLDGLAGGLVAIAFGAMSIIALAQGKIELAGFSATIIGVMLTYTWFNIPPARFYMGDTGSLALGATLGVVAMLTNTALVLPIIGAVFVVEVLVSIIQIIGKLFWKRKIFPSAPLHHTLESMGWSEAKIVMRLWVVGLLFGTIGLFLALLGRG